jgi:hypothetical protein
MAKSIAHQTDKYEDQFPLQDPLDSSASDLIIGKQDGVLKRSEDILYATVIRQGSELIFDGPLDDVDSISDMDDTDDVDDTDIVEDEDESPLDTDHLPKANKALTMIASQPLLSRVLAHTKPKLAFTVFVCSTISFFLGCRFTELQAVRVKLPNSDIIVNAFFPQHESKVLPAVIIGLALGVIAELLYYGLTVAWGERIQDEE